MTAIALRVPAPTGSSKAHQKPAKLEFLDFPEEFENVVNLILDVNKLTTLEANCFRVKNGITGTSRSILLGIIAERVTVDT